MKKHTFSSIFALFNATKETEIGTGGSETEKPSEENKKPIPRPK